jgi:hypothetical protein
MWISLRKIRRPRLRKGERVREERFFEASSSSSSRDKQVASEQPQQWKQREQLAAS